MSYRVLVVQPAFSANAYVVHARSLGWDVVVASHENEGRRVADAVRSLATEILTVDTNDNAALEAAVERAHRRNPIHAVVAGGEYYVPAAARLSALLGLSGLDLDAVDKVRHKASMREAVAAAGLEVPKFIVVGDPKEIDDACAYVGFPAVIKPVDSGGSVHVSRVDTVEEARAALAAMHAEEGLEFDRALTTDAILEQYVPGAEYSADGHVHDGEVVVVAVTRKLLGPEPRFLELGHLTPTRSTTVPATRWPRTPPTSSGPSGSRRGRSTASCASTRAARSSWKSPRGCPGTRSPNSWRWPPAWCCRAGSSRTSPAPTR